MYIAAIVLAAILMRSFLCMFLCMFLCLFVLACADKATDGPADSGWQVMVHHASPIARRQVIVLVDGEDAGVN